MTRDIRQVVTSMTVITAEPVRTKRKKEGDVVRMIVASAYKT